MGNLQNYVHNMWKEAAERNAAKVPQPNMQIPQRRLDPLVDLVEAVREKKIFKKPTPEEIARRILNNSKKYRYVR
jgi:hypothetical protein